MAVSEVAQLRQRIADEYLAAKLGLSGLAYGTSRHLFITSRMENMQRTHEQLQEIVGDQAMALIALTLQDLSDLPTRDQLPGVLRHELGNGEETTYLIERIHTMWETMDLFVARFGNEAAQKIITTPERAITAS